MREEHGNRYITTHETDSQGGVAIYHRELNLVLCDNLKEWDGVGGRFDRQGTSVYLWLIHIHVWQEPTQHYKAIILQLKIIFF